MRMNRISLFIIAVTCTTLCTTACLANDCDTEPGYCATLECTTINNDHLIGDTSPTYCYPDECHRAPYDKKHEDIHIIEKDITPTTIDCDYSPADNGFITVKVSGWAGTKVCQNGWCGDPNSQNGCPTKIPENSHQVDDQCNWECNSDAIRIQNENICAKPCGQGEYMNSEYNCADCPISTSILTLTGEPSVATGITDSPSDESSCKLPKNTHYKDANGNEFQVNTDCVIKQQQ